MIGLRRCCPLNGWSAQLHRSPRPRPSWTRRYRRNLWTHQVTSRRPRRGAWSRAPPALRWALTAPGRARARRTTRCRRRERGGGVCAYGRIRIGGTIDVDGPRHGPADRSACRWASEARKLRERVARGDHALVREIAGAPAEPCWSEPGTSRVPGGPATPWCCHDIEVGPSRCLFGPGMTTNHLNARNAPRVAS